MNEEDDFIVILKNVIHFSVTCKDDPSVGNYEWSKRFSLQQLAIYRRVISMMMTFDPRL